MSHLNNSKTVLARIAKLECGNSLDTSTLRPEMMSLSTSGRRQIAIFIMSTQKMLIFCMSVNERKVLNWVWPRRGRFTASLCPLFVVGYCLGFIDSSKLISILKHNKKVETKPGPDIAVVYSDWLLAVFRDLRVGALEAQVAGETHWVTFDRLPQIKISIRL